jgi:hypothetical protein
MRSQEHLRTEKETMKRIHLLLGAVVVTLVAAAFVVPNLASAKSSSRNKFTVVARDKDATVTPANYFSAKPKLNAQATEDAPVYRGSDKVGMAETVYNITRVVGDDVVLMINCSVELPEGNVLFNGTAHMADLTHGAAIPVVGGTRAYAKARGIVTAVGAADGSTTTLKFDIKMK